MHRHTASFAEAASAKREAMRREMLAANEAMLAARAKREQARAAEEAALREEMMARLAEDDRIEQLNAQRRRMKARILQDFAAAQHA